MSHFVASAIRFKSEFSTYELFGDDNNVFPKFNRWSREIPTEDLMRELDGGIITLTKSKYPTIHQALKTAQQEFVKRFGEMDWDTNQKSIWHWPYMVQENKVSEEDKIFFAKLESDFIASIKGKFRSTSSTTVIQAPLFI